MTLTYPIVSVVCLNYNQARFVKEAIYSVLDQTYRSIQLVVVDDASCDGSQQIIHSIVASHPDILYLPLKKNVGNCKAFNIGLRQCTGDFIIDLSADDLLFPDRIQEGITALQSPCSTTFGVHFSDAEIIDERGHVKGYHSDRFPHDTIPQGNVYKDLIVRYFINAPTMMVRKDVFDKLEGYDENLAYEDFDFWIRSSRYINYCYTPRPLVRRRVVHNSMSYRQFVRNSSQQLSTYAVCKKIQQLNRTLEEDRRLCTRLIYEIKVCIRLFSMLLAWRYLMLWIKVKNATRK